MKKQTFKPGDRVAFAQAVIRRCDDQAFTARARGTVVSTRGPVVSVDWHGSWIEHEDGGTIRHLPAANLTRILANGAVFGDQ